MSEVEIIVAPFHAGAPEVRVGRGPARLLREGLAERLGARVTTIAPVDGFEGEIGRSFEVKRRVARAVADAVAGGRFPVVLAGNCNVSIGVHAGLAAPDAGVVWFDAHPDFDTPDEAMSGYFDGMGAATLTGQCWRGLAASIPGFRPLPEERLVWCGVRDFEHGQDDKVRASAGAAVFGGRNTPVELASALDEALDAAPFNAALIHLDLDVLDVSVGRANEYAAPGGLTADGLDACLRTACERVRPLALTVASFNPDLEGADAIARAGVRAIERVVSSAAGA